MAAADFPLRRTAPGVYATIVHPALRIARHVAFGSLRPADDWSAFCNTDDRVRRWLLDTGLHGARFASLREARAALAAQHAVMPIPAPLPQDTDTAALIRVRAGMHRTPCGAWTVTRTPDGRAWEIEDNLCGRGLSSRRTLREAAHAIANMDPATRR